MTITTTLADIRAANPCHTFSKICNHFGVTRCQAKTHHEEFPVALLLKTNDLDDTLWVLDNVIGNQRICSLFAADCAERVLPIFLKVRPDDKRPADAIAVARNPNATDEERAAAAAAAWAAAAAAARAADAADAAYAAAWAAADAADAADAAAAAAAWAAAWAAARAARDAARAAQKARLQQYLEHGEAAADMPWPEVEVSQ
ncbi:putative immunity protein [uncultured Roseobacter sp.]|uniref:putative immunity protein n=1 Tax=uncultured Roseobacter sp. TaxID=114847 RepID=UPI002621D168|nr:hypothetical protein [uncultured Roseobacter sp.]